MWPIVSIWVGSNLTVDAACASSLAAMYVACNELASGAADMVISGGCDTLQNPMGFSCFDSAGALSPRGKCRPFDATADGIAISEGLAAVVLKRRKDAERDGDRIYALIRAVASGSDGRTKCLMHLAQKDSCKHFNGRIARLESTLPR